MSKEKTALQKLKDKKKEALKKINDNLSLKNLVNQKQTEKE